MTKRLRNIFDQYSQQENHLTNSLLLVLNHNRNLLTSILKHCDIKLTGKQLNLLSQIAPVSVKDAESIPDGYIYTEDYEFCVGIETKIVHGSLRKPQLVGHLKQLAQYDKSFLLVLTPDDAPPPVVLDLQKAHQNLRFISWIELVRLMSRVGPDRGKNEVGCFVFDEFMGFMERQYEMTPFTGINFRDGYDKDLAAHYVKRISKEITPSMMKMYPECRYTRKAIKSAGGYPWESWFPNEKIQTAVHFTLSVKPENIRCMMILANGCKAEWKKLLEMLEDPTLFRRNLKKVYNTAPAGARTVVAFRQRHYIGQTVQVSDAKTELNVAMLLGADESKENEIWWNLMRELCRTKTKFNYQLEVSYDLPYDKIPDLKTTAALPLILRCYKNLKPVYEILRG